MGLETIFWPSPACSYWGTTRSYTPGTHRARGTEVEGWEGSNRGAFTGNGDQERWARREENFLPRGGSRGVMVVAAAGPSRRRPPLRSPPGHISVHPAAGERWRREPPGPSRRGAGKSARSPARPLSLCRVPWPGPAPSPAPRGRRGRAGPQASQRADRRPSPHTPRGSLSRGRAGGSGEGGAGRAPRVA